MKLIALNLLLLFFTFIIGCSNSTTDNNTNSSDIKSINAIGYNLSDPDKTIILPGILHEISGISLIDSSSVACIQDENGIVYIFDLLKNNIQKQIVFHSNGDYEDIARVDESLFILRSDGMLFKIESFMSPDFMKVTFSTGMPVNDNEGLCYDLKNRRLLIAGKRDAGKGPGKKEKRPVYGFDLDSEIIIKEPVFMVDLSALKNFAGDNKIVQKKKGKKKKKESEPAIEFRPSAIGIHPLTNKVYVLSGMERMLFVFDITGTIEYIEKLDPDLFNMPEGIAFFKNGDMLISNEGQNKNPTILKFNYK